MAKANKSCYTCNKSYYYCSTCPGEKKEVYNNMFCCERCSKIFKTLTDETFKRIDIAECKKQLMELNVSTEETLKDGIKKHVSRILDYKEPIVEIVKEEFTSSNIDSAAETPIKKNIDEEVPTKKIIYSHMKSKRQRNSEVD
jgi:hypothetical protein